MDSTDRRSWFEQVVVENYRLFFSIAYQCLRNREEAEDAMHDAILKGFKSLGNLRDDKQIVSWLCRIVRNKCIDRVRKGGSTKVHSGLDHEPPVEPETPLRKDERALLLEELAQLPEGQQQVVTLRYLEELNIGEIAKRMGLTPNATRVRLHRGLERLRSSPLLKRHFSEESR